MLNFLNAEWKNFLSYGNNKSRYDFKTNSTLITGVNGVGKSTLIEVVYFAMFGKPYRNIKLKQLINTKNKKGLEVTLNFKKLDDVYRIERGLKPDYFRIYKNDVLIPVSSSKRGYQQILEEDIFQYNENICNQVTIKSITKNAAFMTLPKAERRNIIENLFNIEIFSHMNKILKSKMDILEQKIKDTKKDVEHTDILINQELLNIEQLKNLQQKFEAETEKQNEILQEEITSLLNANLKFDKALVIINKNKKIKNEKLQSVADIQEKIEKLQTKKDSLINQRSFFEKKVKLFENTCSGCPKIQSMVEDFDYDNHNKEIETINSEISNYNKSISQLKAEIDKNNEIISNEKFVTASILQNKNRINSLNNKISELNKEVVKIDYHNLKMYNVKKDKLTNKFNAYTKMKIHCQTLKLLFSDDGIKAKITKKYLPHINKLLNTYLNRFHADMIFNFDDEFNEVILTKYKENFTYHSFSEGQKKRIDLAVLFSFIVFAIQKNKKSNTNLLFLDEVMSGLDDVGKSSLHEVINDLKNKQHKCIITINPDTNIDPDNYDEAYRVKLEKGFSKMEDFKL